MSLPRNSSVSSESTSSLTASSLSELVKNNDLEQIKKVVQHLKTAKDWRWVHDNERVIEGAVRDAILLGQLETVRYFLEQEVSVNAHPYHSGNSGFVVPLISFAAQTGNLAMVQLLVEQGAEIKPHDSYYNKGDDSGIRDAVKAGHADIVDYLLQHGATASGVIGGMRRDTFIAYAAKKGYIRIIESLLQHGARIENSFDLAREKYRERISDYENALANNYSEERRQDKIKWGGSKESLQEFDDKKKLITRKLNKYINTYDRIIKTLLDYAIGTDLSSVSEEFMDRHGGLTFLHGLNVSGFNFVGVSINGKPITRALLKELKIEGVDNAIVTEEDLNRLQATDPGRYTAIRTRLNMCVQRQGLLFAEPGIYNLIPLSRAAQIGDEAAVCARLTAGVNPNEKNNIGHPLVLAAANAHTDIVRRIVAHPLLDKKAIVTALEKAAKIGNANLINCLQSQVDVNMLDNKGNTLLHIAAEEGDVAQVTSLIARGADVNLKNQNGNTALTIAAQHSGSEYGISKKHAEVIRILLNNNADPNKYEWYSPLSLAFEGGNVEAVTLLLPKTTKKELIRTDLSNKEVSRDPWYVDIMFESIRKKDCIKLLTLLAEEGADFNAKNQRGDTLLMHAVYCLPSFSNISSTMRDLVRAGYGAARMGDALQRTQQELIAKSQEYFNTELKTLDFLFANGCDARISGGRDGQTPLALLIKKKDLSHLGDAAELVMDRFLQHGADINAVDNYGNAPLHEAARTGDTMAIKYLLKHDAAVNPQNKKGFTPLHLAAASGNSESTKLLLELGADHTMKDNDGLTPAELSKKSMFEDKKRYNFSSRTAEREFESKYLAAQVAISDFVWNKRSSISRQNDEKDIAAMEICKNSSNSQRLS